MGGGDVGDGRMGGWGDGGVSWMGRWGGDFALLGYFACLALQIAKNTVNICYFAFVRSPNCKKHSKYRLFCTCWLC